MEKKQIESIMRMAIEKARETMNEDAGGPFGAAVVTKDGNVVSISSNRVLKDCDPSAHAEINAIREAGHVLNTHDLKGHVLIATAYPCPMCLGAIIWANIDTVIYGCRPEDAEAIGFRDDYIYRFIRKGNKDTRVLNIEEVDRAECLQLFKEYQDKEKTLY